MPSAPPSEPSPNQRADARAPIELRVDYRRLNTFFADYTKNISKGGTFIRTNKPLGVGTQFSFVLSLPEPHGTLSLRGEVLRTVPPEATAPGEDAGMAIRFVFANPREEEALEAMVEGLMRDALGEVLSDRLLRGKDEHGKG